MESFVQDDHMNDGFPNDFVDGFTSNNNNGIPPLNKKRKLNDDMNLEMETTIISRKTFLPIRGGSDVFMTEEWRKSTSAMFIPVANDVYINLSKYDQITASQGSFFTADDSGNFRQTCMGHVIHLWRYDKTERKLYIALSYLFTLTSVLDAYWFRNISDTMTFHDGNKAVFHFGFGDLYH